jgi:effector-binding domain-containing protein
MKRRNIFLLSVVAIIIVGIIASFSTFTIHRHIIVHATIEKVAMQFTSAENWKYWHPAVSKDTSSVTINTHNKQQEIVLPDHSIYRIQIVNPASVLIERNNRGKTTKALLSALPYKDGTYTYIDYAEPINGFTWMTSKFPGNNDEAHLLQGLKSFAEDDSKNYGFYIKTVPVIDTLILTTTMLTTRDKLTSNIPILYQRLLQFCNAHTIEAARNYYFVSSSFVDEKQVQLAVGLPVQQEATGQQKDYQFLKLPSNGRLLMGRYNGKYAGKQQLYAAMDRYILDKRLKKVAQPLEQYHDTDTMFTADKDISMTLFYPIF